MSRSAFPIRIVGRIVGVVSVVLLLALVLTGPAAALTSLYQETTPEPTPRDTATPAPYFELNPVQGVAGDATQVVATGAFWSSGGVVTLYWDNESRILGSATVGAGGSIQVTFQTPTDAEHATIGIHTVIAKQGGYQATAPFELIAPSPTPTPPQPGLAVDPNEGIAGDETEVTATGTLWVAGQVVTLYWDGVGGKELGQTTAKANGRITFVFTTPTRRALAGVGPHTVMAMAPNGQQAQVLFTLVEPSPTLTPSPSPTSSPSPTLRPITPMVTITPIPPTKGPARTSVPAATRTNTPVPGTATSTLTPSITPTPSNTPTVTNTPGPGTPSVTPQPTSGPTLTPTPVGETPETGAGWGPVFLWGFVLAGLVVVFRLLRVKSVGNQG